MSRFLIVATEEWGHIDFGGRSFLRVAQGLREHSHDVDWLYVPLKRSTIHTAAFEGDGASGLRRTVTEAGLSLLERDHDWALHPFRPAEAIGASIQALAARMRERQYDSVLVDRICPYAGIAAELAGIPFVAVGTDGRSWRFQLNAEGVEATRGCPAKSFDEIRALVGSKDHRWVGPSEWTQSPFLNLSFFPSSFWGEVPELDTASPHSHFVGGDLGKDVTASAEVARKLVISCGTSWHSRARAAVFEALPRLAECFSDVHITMVTGVETDTQRLQALARPGRLTVKTWEDYTRLFTHAEVCVGHGGTAFLWQAFHEAATVLVVAPNAGDQKHNARRVEALGVGRVVPLERLSESTLLAELQHLLAEPKYQVSAEVIRRKLHAGGGVPAAIALVERLARTNEPVTTCASHPCCS